MFGKDEKYYFITQYFLFNWIVLIILIECSFSGNGFMIVPKKTFPNNTKGFDNDKNKSRITPVTDTTIFMSTEKSLLTLKEEYFNELLNKTHFKTDNMTTYTTQVGSIVQIPCQVHLIGDEVVSWIRRKDYHLLTVGLTTYSSDERFSAVNVPSSEDWRLKIKYVQLRDAGTYECQISTHPPISIFIQLNVVEARAEISGSPEKYLKPGSMLRLSCRIIENIEPPLYIFWYHNSRMINYDTHRGVNVSIESDNKYSELVILQTNTNHSGNYSCVTNNAVPASTFVHILNGENPAAMQHGDSGNTIHLSISIQMIVVLLVTYQIVVLDQLT